MSEMRDQILSDLRKIALQVLKDVPAAVYLFGSWARGQERRNSDIDIAVQFKRRPRRAFLSELREQLEESHIPYRVDVVDLNLASKQFRRNVLKDVIRWIG